MTDQLLVPLDEVGHRLGGLSRRKIQDLIYRGELRSVMVGRRRLIATVDLEAFVQRLRELNACEPVLVVGGPGRRRRVEVGAERLEVMP